MVIMLQVQAPCSVVSRVSSIETET